MPRFSPYDLNLQINRMFEQGQSFFATMKVEDWLRERQADPKEYEINFQQQPASPQSGSKTQIRIVLKRRDGQPVDPWLLQELNKQSG
jgi:hypothetical protein